MKQNIYLLLFILCFSCSMPLLAQTSVTPETGYTHAFRYSYTGSAQTFTVPAGVSEIKVKAWGAAGGSDTENQSVANYSGGPGGYATGIISVTPGETITIIVGEGGKVTSTVGTFGGGGAGGSGNGVRKASSGGGLSGVFLNSFTHANALLIAGGGGGASLGGGTCANNPTTGSNAAGGGTSGNSGSTDVAGCTENNGGRGGTQTTGGAAGASSAAVAPTAGSALQGGNGGGSSSALGEGGGGGGGGYYGGGGGGLSPTDLRSGYGGGGSGYLHPARVSSGSFIVSAMTGAPQFAAPNTGDTHYQTGIAAPTKEGGAVGATYVAGKNGGNGMVIIQYAAEVCGDNIDNDGDGLVDDFDTHATGCSTAFGAPFACAPDSVYVLHYAQTTGFNTLRMVMLNPNTRAILDTVRTFNYATRMWCAQINPVDRYAYAIVNRSDFTDSCYLVKMDANFNVQHLGKININMNGGTIVGALGFTAAGKMYVSVQTPTNSIINIVNVNTKTVESTINATGCSNISDYVYFPDTPNKLYFLEYGDKFKVIDVPTGTISTIASATNLQGTGNAYINIHDPKHQLLAA